LYAAYASNMDPAQMALRCPHSPQRSTGWLAGWRLTFGGADNGDVLSWLYVLNAYEGGLPSARYLGILADAAEKAGAPADYVADLRARPCSTIGRETRP
jgi:hypothetical protein